MVTNVTSLGRSGLYDWMVQRVSAVVLAVYFLFIMIYLLQNPGLDYASWKAFFSQTYVRIFSLLALLSLGAHAWIGLWTIATDYITIRLLGKWATAIRFLFQCGSVVVMFVYIVWGIQILWGA